MPDESGNKSDHWLRARISWLYFVGGVTQNQIADTHGVSRATVSRIITRAREEGLVKVQLTVPLTDCLDLADRLQRSFGLTHAIVIPATPDYEGLQRTIGETAGDYLDSIIAQYDGLALGWGRTLSFAVNRLSTRMSAGYDVVGLMGARPYGSDSNPFEVIAAAARMTGGTGHYMTVPILVPNADIRHALSSHPEIAQVLAAADRAQIALMACGDLSDRNLMMSIPPIREVRAELEAAGAVGDLLGRFLNVDGRPVDHPIQDQIFATPIAALKAKRATILAAGGTNKVAIIRSILKGGYANRLVTDEGTATSLLSASTAPAS